MADDEVAGVATDGSTATGDMAVSITSADPQSTAVGSTVNTWVIAHQLRENFQILPFFMDFIDNHSTLTAACNCCEYRSILHVEDVQCSSL